MKPIAAGLPAPPASWWETTLRPFLDRRALALAILLIAIGAARVASTWTRFCFTNDEPQHFACGIEYLEQHVYRYSTEQPPLSRVAMAVAPYLDGSRLAGHRAKHDEEGVAIIYQHGNPQRTLTLMRLGILPFFVLGAWLVFLWARHHFGGPTAVIATALFTLEPTVLAHAGLATTDTVFATCLTAAFFAMILWVEKPTLRNAALFGFDGGAVLLAKFTALVYFPAAAVFALLWYLALHRPSAAELKSLVKERIPSAGIAAAIAFVTIWAGYLFTFGKLPGMSFPVPAPEFFDGIGVVLKHNAEGHPSFLLGQHGRTGWWYYFPVVLAVKTPLAFLLLAVFGAFLCIRRKQTAWMLPLAFSLGILLPAMVGSINIGLRHILPIFAGLSIAGAVAVVQLAEWADSRKWAGPAAFAALLWLLGAGIWNHPYYLAYFNELAGDHPENIVVDSDFDWSQDYVEVAQRLRAMNVTEVNFGFAPWLNAYYQIWPGFPKIRPVQALIPAAGWTVISPSFDKLNQYGLLYRYPNLEPWWKS